MPETRFEDLMVIHLHAAETEAAIDSRFLEVCEPGSVVVKSAVPNVPMILGAFTHGESVHIRTHGHINGRTAVVVTLSGIRKGRAGRRFPTFSEEQARQNEKFWTASYGET
jgi:hypothetical protein